MYTIQSLNEETRKLKITISHTYTHKHISHQKHTCTDLNINMSLMSMGHNCLIETCSRNLTLWESRALEFGTKIQKSLVSFHKDPLIMLISMVMEGASQKEILSHNLHCCINFLKPPTQSQAEKLLHLGPLSTSHFSPSTHQGISFLSPSLLSFCEMNTYPTKCLIREKSYNFVNHISTAICPPNHPFIDLCSSSHLLICFP